MFKKIIAFFKEVQLELKKVTWPQRKDVIKSTTVVITTISLVALFLYLVDLSLQRVVSFILR